MSITHDNAMLYDGMMMLDTVRIMGVASSPHSVCINGKPVTYFYDQYKVSHTEVLSSQLPTEYFDFAASWLTPHPSSQCDVTAGCTTRGREWPRLRAY